MIRVAIVGTGNVGNHFAKAFSKTKDVRIVQVINSRIDSLEADQDLNIQKDGLLKRENPDLYILAVSDDAIALVSQKLKNTKSLVVHTSGSVAMKVLPKAVRRGVFYPLQTFSKKSEIDFAQIPICIEAERKEDLELLRDLAGQLSDEVHEVPSEKRAHLHLAAVFANNFTNHLYHVAGEICESQNLPFSLLEPLIQETAKKMTVLTSREAQTGPARRGDIATISKHLDLLTNKEHREIYSLLSQAIQKTYGEKL